MRSEDEAIRDKKIIVALFLILARALEKLPPTDRDIRVSEIEIKKAWTDQKSPVRVIGERPEFAQWDMEDPGMTFRAVLQELDLKKVNFIPPNTPYPEEKRVKAAPEAHPKGRVFDLE